jgi:Cohesin domain
MFPRLRISIVCTLLALFCQCLNAQISFGVPTLSNLQPGDEVLIPVTAISGFDSVESIQFVVKWDSTVLKYVGTQNYGLPQLTASNFGTNRGDLVRFAYTDPNVLSGKGITVPNNTVLFVVKLKVIGPINSGSPIQITEDQPITYFEIILANGKIFTLSNTSITNGFAPVGYNLMATNVPFIPFEISLFPNPATDHVWLTTRETTSEDVQLTILSAEGKTLKNLTFRLYPDIPYRVDLRDLPRGSINFLLIRADIRSAIKPIVFKNE